MRIVVKITPNDRGNPPGKLADAELHFTDGELEGLKLIGFSVWERRGGNGRNVTFPARQYAVNGERRSFARCAPIADTSAQNRVRALVVDARGHSLLPLPLALAGNEHVRAVFEACERTGPRWIACARS